VAKPPDPPAEPDPEPQPDRLEQIEAEQATQKATLDEHGGMLQKILDKLPGGQADPTDGDQAGQGDGGGQSHPPVDVAAAVRKEIADAKARAEDEARAKGDADWRKHVDDALEVLKPEKPPREPQTGIKGRLQRAMFGADDR